MVIIIALLHNGGNISVSLVNIILTLALTLIFLLHFDGIFNFYMKPIICILNIPNKTLWVSFNKYLFILFYVKFMYVNHLYTILKKFKENKLSLKLQFIVNYHLGEGSHFQSRKCS